ILSDEAFLLQKALKLPAFETGGVAYLKRLTLIVRDGRIEHVFYPVPTPAAHVLEVFAWLTQTRLPGAA
ncbi:MAG: peroxiredoxin, partial [Hyphomicrobium sp.]